MFSDLDIEKQKLSSPEKIDDVESIPDFIQKHIYKYPKGPKQVRNLMELYKEKYPSVKVDLSKFRYNLSKLNQIDTSLPTMTPTSDISNNNVNQSVSEMDEIIQKIIDITNVDKIKVKVNKNQSKKEELISKYRMIFLK